MTTPTTKEQLIARIETQKETALKHPECSVALMDLEIANIARAAMDAEPVAYADPQALRNFLAGDARREWMWRNPAPDLISLYAAPPVVPDGILAAMEEVLRISDRDHEAWHKAKQGIADCRAAMLNHSENERDMVELVRTAYKLPPNSFTNDDLEMMAHGNNPQSNAYRELLAFRRNSPVIPDGWVKCSERMPSAGEQVLAYRPDAPESNDPLIKMATYVGGSAHGHGFDCYCKPTHWMPLPAAPQQEGN
ncbi:DUF551 domain-containing protein [Pseudocitrobacter sp. MW920760]|uniref:DUF551 domain-containing protein n=1 Tax=Pseudocitrobacter sp. MW920760 TaxID=2981140 RepID=UPI002E198B5D|nr:DUF551 domain-containing protein [Pseudocitrobacter sp. MW920760]